MSSSGDLTLLPMFRWIQRATLACLWVSAFQFLDVSALVSGPGTSPGRPSTFLVVAIIVAAEAVGLLWWVRSRATTDRARAGASLGALVLVCAIAQFGQIGFTAPALILAVALIAIDLGWRASLFASLVVLAGLGAVMWTLFPLPWWLAMINIAPIAILASLGALCGEIVLRHDSIMRQLRTTVRERDEALRQLLDRAETDKALMLSRERARAAAELHDGLGHRLTLITMSLTYAERMREVDPDAAWAEVEGARAASEEAMSSMRTWVRALSPARLGGGRGLDGLEAVVASFRSTGLDIGLTTSGADVALSDASELLMYRAVQEGLTNALRHAGATAVQIDVRVTTREMRVCVRNAVEPGSAQVGPVPPEAYGVGLAGLSESARSLGGGLRAGVLGKENPTFTLEMWSAP